MEAVQVEGVPLIDTAGPLAVGLFGFIVTLS